MNDCPDPGIAAAIRGKALALGFARVGFCDVGAAAPPETVHFERWLAGGMQADMAWMEKGRARRLDPRRILPGARSLVVVALPYARPGGPEPAAPQPSEGGAGVVSRYARGEDYHRVMGRGLRELERFIEARAVGHRALYYVDTGAVLERMWAARAGVGWIGRNALVIDRDLGSYFFLGVVLTTLPLPADRPATDQCGSCALCLDACPTGAIVEARLVDSRRCLSYHTIELRGPLPADHRAALGARVFGCDDCQEVCPWNGPGAPARAIAGPDPFPPRAASTAPSLLDLLAMTRQQHHERFHDSAIRRATWSGLRRNAAAALGNVGRDAGTLRDLERVGADPDEDPIVKEQAVWSAGRVRQRLEERRVTRRPPAPAASGGPAPRWRR